MEDTSSKGKEGESIISIPKGKREFDAALFGATIQKGFAKLHKDEQTSDIILLVGEEKIPTHRMVLCAWSDTFRGMLETGSWQESNQKELRVNIEEDDYANFKLLIEYMYTGNADFVEDDNVIPLISLTNYYGIHSLKEVCGRLLGEQINDSNVQFLLDLVDKYDCKELEKKCGEYLASNFEYMWADDPQKVLALRTDTWAAMLQSDDLSVPSEQLLFGIIKQFIEVKESDEEERKKLLDRLLPHIRFCSLSAKYLTEVVEKDPVLMSHPLMTKILFEAYRYFVNRKCVPKLFQVRRRTAVQQFDDSNKTQGALLSEENTKMTTSSGNWENARVVVPFADNYIYCEFQCDANIDIMIGATVGNLVTSPFTGNYFGQDANGYCIHNQDGSFYYAGGQYQTTGVTWYGGGKVGVAHVPGSNQLHWYKDGNRVYSHTMAQVNGEVYAAVSLTTSGSAGLGVTLVPHPTLPDDLIESLASRRAQRKVK